MRHTNPIRVTIAERESLGGSLSERDASRGL